MYIQYIDLNKSNFYTDQFVDMPTVTSDSPLISQPGSSQTNLNNELGESQFIIEMSVTLYTHHMYIN